MILAVDPGLRWCGCALGLRGGLGNSTLTKAALVLNTIKEERGPRAWRAMAQMVEVWVRFSVPMPLDLELYVEVPRIYPQSDQRKGDLNDLIELAGVVGALTSYWRSVSFYYPADWKGQVPKKIMTERIRKKLRPEELDKIVSSGAKDHNTLDAVGIFLHSVGRL